MPDRLNYDQIRELVAQAQNRSEGGITLPTADLLAILPEDPDAMIHAIAVKHCIALPELVARDMALYLFGPHKSS